eukprot:4894141-Amphidinium_carterae.1
MTSRPVRPLHTSRAKDVPMQQVPLVAMSQVRTPHLGGGMWSALQSECGCKRVGRNAMKATWLCNVRRRFEDSGKEPPLPVKRSTRSGSCRKPVAPRGAACAPFSPARRKWLRLSYQSFSLSV